MKLSELLYGKRMPHQSQHEYEAGKPLARGCWVFALLALVALARALL